MELDKLERSVLKSLQKSKRANNSQVAAMLPAAGTSEVDAASRALADQRLVEPVPGATDGSMRLTAQGERLAQSVPDEIDHAGSGGGDSKFE